MDLITNLLSTMKLTGSAFLKADFTHPWAVESQIGPSECGPFFPEPDHVIAYHFVVAGRCYCSLDGMDPVPLSAGQIVIVPRNERHVMRSCLTTAPVDGRALARPDPETGLFRLEAGGGGEATEVYCGYLGSSNPVSPLLLRLPRLMVIDAARPGGGEWLASSIRYASGLGARNSPEQVAKLAELLFAEGVRHYLENLPPAEQAGLAALRDRHVGRALSLLDARIADAWTIEELAREVGLSRSALAERFVTLTGEPPMRYLTRRRMAIAADLLREGGHNACNVAYGVGFNSEAAFSRAFKKEFGVPPGSWRKRTAAPATA